MTSSILGLISFALSLSSVTFLLNNNQLESQSILTKILLVLIWTLSLVFIIGGFKLIKKTENAFSRFLYLSELSFLVLSCAFLLVVLNIHLRTKNTILTLSPGEAVRFDIEKNLRSNWSFSSSVNNGVDYFVNSKSLIESINPEYSKDLNIALADIEIKLLQPYINQEESQFKKNRIILSKGEQSFYKQNSKIIDAFLKKLFKIRKEKKVNYSKWKSVALALAKFISGRSFVEITTPDKVGLQKLDILHLYSNMRMSGLKNWAVSYSYSGIVQFTIAKDEPQKINNYILTAVKRQNYLLIAGDTLETENILFDNELITIGSQKYVFHSVLPKDGKVNDGYIKSVYFNLQNELTKRREALLQFTNLKDEIEYKLLSEIKLKNQKVKESIMLVNFLFIYRPSFAFAICLWLLFVSLFAVLSLRILARIYRR